MQHSLQKKTAKGAAAKAAALVVLALLAAPFSYYAAVFGIEGLGGSAKRDTYLFIPGAVWSNAAISVHMLIGAVLPVLVPLQLVLGLSGRLPALHRWLGRVLVLAACVTAAGGLAFTAWQGTIGGWPMDAGFAVYGLLLLAAAIQTARLARQGQTVRHRRWALRLLVLAMGSWLYRVQYGLWVLATGGAASNPQFTGGFDLFMTAGFYLPWLLLLELMLRRRTSAP
ncbi:DUF2306 domain-containing protein [Leisingera caerulea]|uniref:DUF2306 domain-containing protein n=1 Tax=Leisingera caerulea TaxID=506591 RepID=A0A9Q9M4C8_LEICA|nr:DUF2306 domain-containing protein [Leisingera caerulea]UWQ55598.1 DUF2306 domain-containing protein [Leisingera caerulea]